MKSWLLAFAILAGSISSSFAACPATTAVMKDNAGSTFNMAMTSDANGNCVMKADWDTSSQAHSDTTSSVTGGTARIGYVSDDPCNSKIKLNAPFSTSSGGPVSLIALSGSTVIYVCSISAITDTAIKLSFIDGTGGSCASAQHAIWGSTTAASGMSLAANGGFTQGSGNGSVGVTTAASALCLLQSGTSLIAGNVVYVQQ